MDVALSVDLPALESMSFVNNFVFFSKCCFESGDSGLDSGQTFRIAIKSPSDRAPSLPISSPLSMEKVECVSEKE